jgi:hypothetical protein
MDEFDYEEQELQKLCSNLKLFGWPVRVERCKDGPGFYLIRWVKKIKPLFSLSDKDVFRWYQDQDYYETIEELIAATNEAISKRTIELFETKNG